MNTLFKAAAFAVAATIGTSASAGVVVFNPAGVSPADASPIAADIAVGDFVVANEFLDPLGTNFFTFTALEDLDIGNIALGGVGNNNGDDLSKVRFGFTASPSTAFSVIDGNGDSASATGVLAGLSLLGGESFTIFWESLEPAANSPVGIQASFRITAPAPVPVPAALPLLAGAIGLLGVIRRKA